jgi:hypothetical protein
MGEAWKGNSAHPHLQCRRLWCLIGSGLGVGLNPIIVEDPLLTSIFARGLEYLVAMRYFPAF